MIAHSLNWDLVLYVLLGAALAFSLTITMLAGLHTYLHLRTRHRKQKRGGLLL